MTSKIYTLGPTASFEKVFPWLMLLLMSISSIVSIEPSPFDLLALLSFFFLFFMGLRIPRGMGLVLFYIGLFILGNILSFSNVEKFQDAFRYMAVSIFLFIIFLLFACLVYYDPEKIMPAFWKGYLFAAVLASLIGALAYFGLIPDSEEFLRYGRAKALFKDPNVYAPFLVAPMLYAGYLLSATRGIRWIISFITLGILTIGMLVGFSRGAVGNLFIAILVFLSLKLFLTPRLSLWVKYVVYGSVMLLAVGIMIGAALQTEKVGKMLEERAKLVQTYDTEAEGGRFDTQRKTLIHGLSDPLGFGPGEEVLEYYIEPHNVYLYILSENGWLGILGFAAFIVSGIRIGIGYLRTAENVTDEYLIIFAVTLATALQSFLIDSIHWRHLFILNGVLWGLTLNEMKCQVTGRIPAIDTRNTTRCSA